MHAAVSQIPSLTALYYISQRKKASSISPTVSVFAKSPTTSPPSDTTRDDNEISLHTAGIAAINIARMFSNWPVEASQLSRNDFRKYLKGKSSVLHIGTHGDINHRNPLMSSIMLGEDFRVLDLSGIQSHICLLVFAACLSGLGKATAGSEVLGFSHVVLGTGCQTYLGTLWNVSDFASMLVMTFFYRKLKTHQRIPLAEILRQAQIEVLSLDSDRANQILDQIGEGWGSKDHNGNCPEDFVPDIEFLLLMAKMTLDQLDWSSPFFWASFVLMGYGGLRFSNQMVD